jgi:hypothetical protein
LRAQAHLDLVGILHDLLEGGAGQAEFDDVLLVRRPF